MQKFIPTPRRRYPLFEQGDTLRSNFRDFPLWLVKVVCINVDGEMVVGVEARTVDVSPGERRGEMAIHIVLFLHNKSSGHALGH